jgi:SMODS and SLOG-associating 2TM effector domain 3
VVCQASGNSIALVCASPAWLPQLGLQHRGGYPSAKPAYSSADSHGGPGARVISASGQLDLQLPAVCEIADRLAGRWQRRYVALVLTELTATVAAAGLGQGSALFAAPIGFEILSAACLTVAIGVHLFSRRMGWNRDWFEDRAVAEVSRSGCWRFMTRTPPFDGGDEDTQRFATAVGNELPRGSARLASMMASLGPTALEATPSMLRVRRADWPDRARLYREQRLIDQQRWYAAKARYNVQWNAGSGSGLWVRIAALERSCSSVC